MKVVLTFAGVWCTVVRGVTQAELLPTKGNDMDDVSQSFTMEDRSCVADGECFRAPCKEASGDSCPLPPDVKCCTEGRPISSIRCTDMSQPGPLDGFECPHVVKIGKYPGYDGNLAVTGVVEIYAYYGEISFGARLFGLEERACETRPEGVENACGIHIHVGNTCEDAAEVGGHYYNATFFDPWQKSVYSTDQWHPGTAVVESMVVDTGYGISNPNQTSSDIVGRAFVVHDSTGGRIGCGLISGSKWRQIMGGVNVV